MVYPVSSVLNLELSNDQNIIKVYNMSGTMMDIINTNVTRYEYDMSAYATGIYFLVVNGSDHYKIIKK